MQEGVFKVFCFFSVVIVFVDQVDFNFDVPKLKKTKKQLLRPSGVAAATWSSSTDTHSGSPPRFPPAQEVQGFNNNEGILWFDLLDFRTGQEREKKNGIQRVCLSISRVIISL